MKKIDPIPQFKNYEEEANFWDNHSALDYPHRFKPVKLSFPNLKPSTKTITIRVSEWLLQKLKQMAAERDVPYQSMIKVYLHDTVKKEMAEATRSKSNKNGINKG